MDANFSPISSTALSEPASSPSSGQGQAGGVSLRGADFANLLGGLISDPGRQGFAADGLAKAGLQAVSLSPQMELITAATPMPETGSLLAFARAQGLDESTLNTLFGEAATATVTTAGMPGTVMPATWTLTESGYFSPPTAALSVLSNPGATPPALPLVGGTAAMGMGVGVVDAEAQDGALALVSASELAWKIHKAPGQATDLAPDAVAAVQASSADDAMQEALRVQLLMPREAIAALTRRLAGLSGTGQSVTWGGLNPSLTGASQPAPGEALAEAAELVDIGSKNGPDWRTPASAEATRSAAAPLAPEAAASQSGQRAEHYQQLADRLGQALAQRLQAQIERGEWKMQMRMDPASLGRIDLELDMRAGGLDAVFRSDNPLTRELIAQGLPKLRDSLSQSGTAVANVWVNGDSARQPGGNPTPRQTPQEGPWKQAADGADAQQLALEAIPMTGIRLGSASGDWDVLA